MQTDRIAVAVRPRAGYEAVDLGFRFARAVFWPLLMGLLRCKEYLLTGDRISSSKAVELGLANYAVPDADLMTAARAMADKLAAQPRQAIQETKRALNLHLQDFILRSAPFALAAEGESFATDDIKNTIDGFKKK